MKKVTKNSAGKPTRGQTSVNSVKTYVKGLKSFCDEHGINMPWKRTSGYYPEDVLMNIDHIKEMRSQNYSLLQT
jgi:hypothetical protein